MVEQQLVQRGIHHPALLNAMRQVPREVFVPPDLQLFSYDDAPLPIGNDQTISQPYIVDRHDRSGPTGDEPSRAGGWDRFGLRSRSHEPHRTARLRNRTSCRSDSGSNQTYCDTRYSNIDLRTGDGTKGWPEKAPFDASLVAASGSEVPSALRDQLAIGGRVLSFRSIEADAGRCYAVSCDALARTSKNMISAP